MTAKIRHLPDFMPGDFNVCPEPRLKDYSSRLDAIDKLPATFLVAKTNLSSSRDFCFKRMVKMGFVIFLLLIVIAIAIFKYDQRERPFDPAEKEEEYRIKIPNITSKEAKALALANNISNAYIADCKNNDSVTSEPSLKSKALDLIENCGDQEVKELALCLHHFSEGHNLSKKEKAYIETCYKLRSFLFDDNWMMHYMAKMWASWKTNKTFIDIENENIKTQVKLFMLMGNHRELEDLSAFDRFRLLISALRWSKQITEAEVEEIRADLNESLAKQDLEKMKSYIKR